MENLSHNCHNLWLNWIESFCNFTIVPGVQDMNAFIDSVLVDSQIWKPFLVERIILDQHLIEAYLGMSIQPQVYVSISNLPLFYLM